MHQSLIETYFTVYNGMAEGPIGQSWYTSMIPATSQPPQVSEQMAAVSVANSPMGYHNMLSSTDMSQPTTSHIYVPTTNNPNELFGKNNIN